MKAVFVAVSLLACGSASAADDPSAEPRSAKTAEADGKTVYEHICQGCHMPQAQGAVGAGHYPKLAGDPALVSWQYVATTVLKGRNGMPAFGTPVSPDGAFASVKLNDQQIAVVVNYVRSHFGNTYKDRVTAEQVAKLPHPAGG